MSVHKLTAGLGYDYLTRQVAALDATEKGHTGLASYYTERGESPGLWIVRWTGSTACCRRPGDRGADASLVSGCGLHPLAELRQQQLEGPDLTTRLSERGVSGGAVQDRRQRSAPVSGRGGQAHRGAQYRHRMAGRRLGSRRLTGLVRTRWHGSSSSPRAWPRAR